MATVFIIHGAYGNPQENWFPRLKKELENLGHTVIVPQFPTPENQTLENWMKIFSRYENNVHEDTIMIGHSIGVAFILDFLSSKEKRLRQHFSSQDLRNHSIILHSTHSTIHLSTNHSIGKRSNNTVPNFSSITQITIPISH